MLAHRTFLVAALMTGCVLSALCGVRGQDPLKQAREARDKLANVLNEKLDLLKKQLAEADKARLDAQRRLDEQTKITQSAKALEAASNKTLDTVKQQLAASESQLRDELGKEDRARLDALNRAKDAVEAATSGLKDAEHRFNEANSRLRKAQEDLLPVQDKLTKAVDWVARLDVELATARGLLVQLKDAASQDMKKVQECNASLAPTRRCGKSRGRKRPRITQGTL